MRAWPEVLDEVQTLQAVVNGASLARYGDGELKMASHDAGIKSQDSDAALSQRLREVLLKPGACLVGLPNIHEVLRQHVSDQKVEHWSKYMRYGRMLSVMDRPYVSAFITRPDSAPWIDTPAYWKLFASLWVGQDVTVVRGSGKSLTGDRLIEWGAGTVTEILAPRQHAWFQYQELLERIGTPARALLCLGPTATVMAMDLCAKGVHAIDCGHVGMFYRKYLAQEPMDVTEDDKAGDRIRMEPVRA